MHHQSSSVTPPAPTKVPTTPMPARQAFTDGVELFSTWTPGEPEPTVAYEDSEITLTAACKLVTACQSSLPKSAVDTLKYCDVELQTRTFSEAARKMLVRIKEFKKNL
jgi:hypothetical protein